ncbi:MAG: oligosaccharide flippase family protein [Acidobacteriaceae bacterium]|jgi:O-antigen/teichoic acid export membrane protein
MISATSARSGVLRNVMETYSAQMVRVAGALLFGIWLTRLLAPTARGYYGVALTLATLATQFGQGGLNTANTYFAASDPRLRRTLLGNSTLLALIIAPCLILVTFSVFRWAPGSLSLPPDCLALALCYIPFALAYIFFQGLLLGTHEIRTYNLLEIANRWLPLAILTVCVVAGVVTSTTVLAAVVLGQIVACVGGGIRVYRVSGGISWSPSLLRRMLRYGIRVHLGTIFSFLLFRADLLMVAHMRAPAEAGYYSLATSLADYLILPATVAGSVLLPHLSTLPDTFEKFRLMRKWLLGMAVATAPVFALGAIVAYPLVRWLFGIRYVPSVPGFLWLLPGVYFLGLACVSVQFITSIGYKLSVPAAWFCILLVNLAGNVYAIPRYGFVGASILSSICYLAASIVIFLIAFSHRRANLSHSQAEYLALRTAPEGGA